MALPSTAQSWLDYDQVLANYPLLNSGNAAALTTFTPTDSTQWLLGDAWLSGSTGHGHLNGIHTAPCTWNIQAGVRSIYRMSRRVVARGSMDYSYHWGKQAGGSVWIDPEQMPFDITETNDSTRGNISLETYRLAGDVGVDVGRGVSLGARFDYTTASGAKKKDPRHVNSLMSCEAGVGILWQFSPWMIGADYSMVRTTESMRFSTYGRTDRVYHYLIDYGVGLGREETTDGNGYVNDDNERPLLDMENGVSLQAVFRHGAWMWGIEGGWRHRHGHYGLESPSLIDFNRHSGNNWGLKSWWQRNGGSTMQRVMICYQHQGIKDYERTYRIITGQGVTDTHYYDDRLVGERGFSQCRLTGDMRWGIKRQLATWQLQACVTHYRRSLTASLYPFYRQQLTRLTQFIMSGTRNWLTTRDHVFSMQLQAGFGNGGGVPSRDGTYQAPDPDAAMPLEHPLYLMRQYEHYTASRLLAGLQAGWSSPIARQRMRLYAEAMFSYRQAFGIHYLEDGYRHQVILTVGLLF